MPTIKLMLNFEEQSASLNRIFMHLPLPLDKLMDMTVKLWEIKIKCPEEYVDELFSTITEELLESPFLKQQVNYYMDNPSMANSNGDMTEMELTDRLLDVAVSKIHLAINALEKMLHMAIGDLMSERGSAITKVEPVQTHAGICFKLTLETNANLYYQAKNETSLYDSWKNNKKIESFIK